MIEGALSEKATNMVAAIKAWLLILAAFGISLGLLLYLGSSFDGWGSEFASVDPGAEGMVLAVVFVAHIGLTVAMFVATCFVGIHLATGANRLFEIYNRNNVIATVHEQKEQERLTNWKAQQNRKLESDTTAS